MSSPLILNDFAIPLGSTVLVTGVNGFIGSHVVDQFIRAGFHVRGTVRDVKKCSWMVGFFAKRHGDGKFELVQVEDMGTPGCFDEAVKGMAGVNVKTVMTALESSLTEPTVKRFVLTSSAWAAAAPKPGIEHTITAETWNDDAVADAWAKRELQSDGMTFFMASKTLAEREAWKWMHEKKPHFTFGAVLPNVVFGAVLSPVNQGVPSTAGCVQMLFDGQNIGFLKSISPQYFIDVINNAKLHVAALVHPQTVNERLFGYSKPFNRNDVLTIFRSIYPQKEFVEDMDLGREISIVANERALELLILVYGKDSWTGLDESVKAKPW